MREGGIERDGAGLKIKGAPGKAKETVSALAAGAKGQELQRWKALVWWGEALCPMGRERPSAMALLSQSLRPQHPLWPLPVAPAFGLTKCHHLGAGCPRPQAHIQAVLDRATITHAERAAGFARSVLVIRCEEESHCWDREKKKKQ